MSKNKNSDRDVVMTLRKLDLYEREMILHFDLPSNQFNLSFKGGSKNKNLEDSHVCKNHCPYYKICKYIPDPIDPSEEGYRKYRFCDFCTRASGDMLNPISAALGSCFPGADEIENISPIYNKIVKYLKSASPYFEESDKDGNNEEIIQHVISMLK